MKKIMQKGFTLVELLIVIALLGALAIGLIGALDPFEQLKKGTDTGTRNNVSEIHSAIIRYYALKGYMPWCNKVGDLAVCDSNPSGIALASGVMVSALSNVVETGELKSNFTQVNSGELSKIFVTGTEVAATVCYTPGSKSFRSDNNTKSDKYGNNKTPCLITDAGACYWCVQ
jgi:prepilin-type N-terminal cleavage/methylation domain-containing protein